jgi:hypothetical protein
MRIRRIRYTRAAAKCRENLEPALVGIAGRFEQKVARGSSHKTKAVLASPNNIHEIHRILLPWTATSRTIASSEEGDQGEDTGPDPKSRSDARRAVPISSTI